jgi:hypothetical protein
MNKHYIIQINGHEADSTYFLTGETLAEAIGSELKVDGQFDWVLEEDQVWTVQDVLDWLNGEAGEFVHIFVSDSPISELN